jgi:Tfp pilus assembly protein PilN
MEVADTAKQWEVILAFAENFAQQDHMRQSIQNSLAGIAVRVSSSATVKKDAALMVQDAADNISPISAGLAMKYFKTGMANLKINLLPAGTNDSYNMKKFALVAANIAIIAFLLSLLAVPVVQGRLSTVNQAIEKYHAAMLAENMATLLKEDAMLSQNNKALQDTVEAVNTIAAGSVTRNWSKIMLDIGSRTPRNVRITGLTAKDNSMRLSGQAFSHAQISKFVELLSKSPYIASAKLAKSEIDPSAQNLLTYDITCTFAAGEVKKYVN